MFYTNVHNVDWPSLTFKTMVHSVDMKVDLAFISSILGILHLRGEAVQFPPGSPNKREIVALFGYPHPH